MAVALGKWVWYLELGVFGKSMFKGMCLHLQKYDLLLNPIKLPDLSVQILKKDTFFPGCGGRRVTDIKSPKSAS